MKAEVKSERVVTATPSAELCPSQTENGWFCIRTHLKHEHIAAAHLRQVPGVDAFNPQVRLLRATRRGRRWATESLFPSYVFASFVGESKLEKVACTPGVKAVVRFGSHVPQIPATVIMELQREVAELACKTLTDAPEDGEEVEVAAGPFAGMRASVTHVWPGKQRAQILIDMMGRPVTADLNLDMVLFHRKYAAQVVLGRSEPVFSARPMVPIPL